MASPPPEYSNTPPPTYLSRGRPPPYTISDRDTSSPSTSSSGLSSWDEDLEAAFIRPPPPYSRAMAHIAVYIPSRGDNDAPLRSYGPNLSGSALVAPRDQLITLGRGVRMTGYEIRCACAALVMILTIVVALVVALEKAGLGKR